MDAKDLSCWKCGASLDGVPLPIGRLAECLSCRAELHVCLLCEFYDTSVAEACREPMAQEVKEKTRANFCEYFYPRPGAYTGAAAAASAPAVELEALFGGGPTASGTPPGSETERAADSDAESHSNLDALFGKPDDD